MPGSTGFAAAVDANWQAEEIAKLDDTARGLVESYSHGEMTALDLRRRLGNATYGDILLLLSEADLPLPRAPTAGREETLKRAREWMFPKHAR